MSLQFRKLLCAILTICLTACASAPAYQIDKDDPNGAIEALSEPEFGSQLQSLRLHLLTHSPPPFRRRNIFIDTSIGGQV